MKSYGSKSTRAWYNNGNVAYPGYIQPGVFSTIYPQPAPAGAMPYTNGMDIGPFKITLWDKSEPKSYLYGAFTIFLNTLWAKSTVYAILNLEDNGSIKYKNIDTQLESFEKKSNVEGNRIKKIEDIKIINIPLLTIISPGSAYHKVELGYYANISPNFSFTVTKNIWTNLSVFITEKQGPILVGGI